MGFYALEVRFWIAGFHNFHESVGQPFGCRVGLCCAKPSVATYHDVECLAGAIDIYFNAVSCGAQSGGAT